MAEIYDSQDLIRGIQETATTPPILGTIASDPTKWSTGIFTYDIDIDDEISGMPVRLRRVREQIPFFYQSGGGLRKIGDRVLLNRLSRTIWEIVGDEITPSNWQGGSPRVFLEKP